jgi:hypothetical protein
MDLVLVTALVFAAFCLMVTAVAFLSLWKMSSHMPNVIAQLQEGQRLQQKALERANLKLMTHCDKGAEIQYANAELILAQARAAGGDSEDIVPHHGPGPGPGPEDNGSARIGELLNHARQRRVAEEDRERRLTGERLGPLPGD